MIAPGFQFTSTRGGAELTVISVTGEGDSAAVLLEHADGQQVMLPIAHVLASIPRHSDIGLNDAELQPDPDPAQADDMMGDRRFIAKAIYDSDCAHIETKGDTMPPEEFNIRAHKPAPFDEAHPEIQAIYFRRAEAVRGALIYLGYVP